jgi:hypothetical protein
VTGDARAEAAGETESRRSAAPKDLVGVFLDTLRALAAAGQVEQACRLAGQACATTRQSDPATCHRFNLLLHGLTKKLP